MLPIIDTHQHLWDLDRFELPWLAEAPSLNRNYVTSDYLEATEGLNVVKTVYMEVDVTPAQHPAEAEHLIALCAAAEHPTAGAVIGGAMMSGEFGDYIRRFAGHAAIKGGAAGAARAGHAAGHLPCAAVCGECAAAGRAGPELRPVYAAVGAGRWRDAGADVSGDPFCSRPLRQRRSLPDQRGAAGRFRRRRGTVSI